MHWIGPLGTNDAAGTTLPITAGAKASHGEPCGGPAGASVGVGARLLTRATVAGWPKAVLTPEIPADVTGAAIDAGVITGGGTGGDSEAARAKRVVGPACS